jgi:hypothetical protein
MRNTHQEVVEHLHKSTEYILIQARACEQEKVFVLERGCSINM